MAEITYNRPELYPKQEAAAFGDQRFAFCEGANQVGKTALMLVWLIEQALDGGKGDNFWWVAPTYNASEDARERAETMLPGEEGGEFWENNITRQRITLKKNGARIFFKSGDKPNNLYGPTVEALVIDEGSRISEEAWDAAKSRLNQTGGPIRVIGNVTNRNNWFYRWCRLAEKDENDHMKYTRLTSLDAAKWGIMDKQLILDDLNSMPAWKFKKVHLAIPPEDEGNPFGLAAIRSCAVDGYSEKEPIVWGWDLGRKNWTVGIGLDKDYAVAKMDRFRKPWGATINRIIETTDGKPALVDATRGSVGDSITERLREKGGMNFTAFEFTSSTKQQLMEHLALKIQNNEIQFPKNSVIQTELENFEYYETRHNTLYHAPQGQHDDCVPPGTMIRVRGGAKPIETIEPGDEVLTHKNRFRPVAKVGRRPAEYLYRVSSIGRPDLRLTGNHRMFLSRRNRTYTHDSSELEHASPVWRSIDDGIDFEQYATTTPVLQQQEPATSLNWASTAPESYRVEDDMLVSYITRSTGTAFRNPKQNPIPATTEIDKEFLWILGYWAAEGSVGNHQLHFASHDREESHRKRVVSFFEELGASAGVTSAKNSQATNVYVSNMPVAEWFRRLGKGADKRLPAWAETLHPDLQWHILRGYWAGDGYRNETSGAAKASTISPHLAYQLWSMFLRCGLRVGLKEVTNRHRASRTYELRMGRPTAGEFYDTDTVPGYDQTSIHLTDDRLYGKIYDVRREEYGGMTYNLEVEEDHSYVANGVIVHNCVDALAMAIYHYKKAHLSASPPRPRSTKKTKSF